MVLHFSTLARRCLLAATVATTPLLGGSGCVASRDSETRSAEAPTDRAGLAGTGQASRVAIATPTDAPPVRLVNFTDAMRRAVTAEHPRLAPLLNTAADWIGTPYVWGGAQPGEGLDCSNFTWLLVREHGLGYDRFLNTRALSRLTRANGLFRIGSSDQARPGDLLVYGYYDKPETQRGWHGHVVMLIDPTGTTTGLRGLALGAHGGDVRQTAYVVAAGYDHGYFRSPELRLRAVLRPEAFE